MSEDAGSTGLAPRELGWAPTPAPASQTAERPRSSRALGLGLEQPAAFQFGSQVGGVVMDVGWVGTRVGIEGANERALYARGSERAARRPLPLVALRAHLVRAFAAYARARSLPNRASSAIICARVSGQDECNWCSSANVARRNARIRFGSFVSRCALIIRANVGGFTPSFGSAMGLAFVAIATPFGRCVRLSNAYTAYRTFERMSRVFTNNLQVERMFAPPIPPLGVDVVSIVCDDRRSNLPIFSCHVTAVRER